MAPTLDRLDFARREVELFSEEWYASKEDECKRMGMIVTKGLHVHEYILSTDEIYRARMGVGSCSYSKGADAQILSLMVAWLDISNDIIADVDGLSGDGFEVEHAERFKGLIEDICEVLSPTFNDANCRADWNQLLIVSRDGFRDRNDGPNGADWWSNAPTERILRVLRYKNLEAAGLIGDELKETADLMKFPGTILSELREPVVMKRAMATSASINW